jgi:ABC-type sugar transport system permease subunit
MDALDQRTMSSRGGVFARLGAAIADNERLFIVITLLPSVVLLGVYVFFPILYSLYLSFFRTQLFSAKAFVGFDQYRTILTDATFWTAFGNTLIFSVASVALTLVLGLGAALLLRRPLPGRDFFRVAMFIPYIVPYAAYALIWYWLFDPRYGLVNYLLSFVFVPAIPWLKSSAWVLPAFIIMSVWKRIGFVMVVFLAGLETIPEELYDAATVDGASRWQKFRHVTLPLLSPITLFIAVITLIYSLQIFVEPLVMTKGGPGDSSQTLGFLLYQQGFTYLKIGTASATAVVLCLVTFAFTLVLLRRFRLQEVFK